jgi:hypothetical protein
MPTVRLDTRPGGEDAILYRCGAFGKTARQCAVLIHPREREGDTAALDQPGMYSATYVFVLNSFVFVAANVLLNIDIDLFHVLSKSVRMDLASADSRP